MTGVTLVCDAPGCKKPAAYYGELRFVDDKEAHVCDEHKGVLSWCAPLPDAKEGETE